MTMLTYFTMPDVTSTLTTASTWFNPLFSEFWSWGLIAVGIGLAFGLISWLASHFTLHK